MKWQRFVWLAHGPLLLFETACCFEFNSSHGNLTGLHEIASVMFWKLKTCSKQNDWHSHMVKPLDKLEYGGSHVLSTSLWVKVVKGSKHG